jgi:hypothetical protein
LLRNTTIAPYRPEHYSTNQAAERPDKKPVGKELSAAAPIAADDPRLGGQSRLSVNTFDVEIPDGARETPRHWRVKIWAVEGREITGRTPESSANPKDNLFARLLREYAESGIDQCR